MRSFINTVLSIFVALVISVPILLILAKWVLPPLVSDGRSPMLTNRSFYTQDEMKRNIEAWPWIVATAEPPGISPRVRPLPRPNFRLAPTNNAGEITDSETVRNLFERVMQALERSPEPALKRDLVSFIFSGKIFLGFRREPNAVGSYRPHEVYEKPTNLIVFNPDQVMRLDDRTQLMDFYLTAYHELSHYRTHLAGRDSNIRKGLLTVEACEERWWSEQAAYAEMCELSRRWNYPSERDFCETRLDSPSFNQRILFRLTSSGSQEHPDSRLACAYIWAKLAGHPQPKMFF